VPQSQDLTPTVLAVLFLGMLIGLLFWILMPFLVAIIWATMIVVTTWPVMTALPGPPAGRAGLGGDGDDAGAVSSS